MHRDAETLSLTLADQLIAELTQEASTTRRVLERVPEPKLRWRPHTRSMTLGQLVMHLALLPGGIAELLSEPAAEAPEVPLPEATTLDEVLVQLERSVAAATAKLSAWGDDGLRAEWRLTRGGETLMVLTRSEMVRTVMLNHWYHHRGQLTVYLRLLDVSLPPVYGPTADESPFA